MNLQPSNRSIEILFPLILIKEENLFSILLQSEWFQCSMRESSEEIRDRESVQIFSRIIDITRVLRVTSVNDRHS